jgi:SAM-dependent methyltransferase
MKSYDVQETRDRQRTQWSAAAEGWLDDRKEFSSATHPVTDAIVANARIRAGDAVLDVACGGGDPALAIAEIVGPGGRVVGVDIVSAMVDGARAEAERTGAQNVTFRAIDDECDPGVEPGTFDAVTSRFGLMFMGDPVRAARAWRAALKPGGRIAVSTWETFPAIPFVLGVIGVHATLPPVDPDAPGIFGISSREKLASILRDAGFANISIEVVRTPVFGTATPEVWWEVMTRSAGPIVMLMRSLPEVTRDAIRTDGIRALHERHPSGAVEEFGDALVGSATNPGAIA